MGQWVPNNLSIKAGLDAFNDRLAGIPEVWRNYATIAASTTAIEAYTYAGHVPIPRVMTGERQIQGMSDGTFNVENETHEVTVLVRRENFEDDQISAITGRFRELAEAMATYKDSLLTTLLENGSSTTLGLAPLDGLAFFHDTRTIGSSGTIDNDVTSVAAADNAVPTTSEFLLQLAIWKAAMLAYGDDRGRPFNMAAMNNMRIAIMPPAEAAVRVGLNSSFVPVVAGDGASDVTKVFQGMAQIDLLPYHTASATTNTMYLAMLGAERRPILYQQRMPLEIILDTTPANVAARNGVLVMARERFKMTYGDPRRMLKQVWTT